MTPSQVIINRYKMLATRAILFLGLLALVGSCAASLNVLQEVKADAMAASISEELSLGNEGKKRGSRKQLTHSPHLRSRLVRSRLALVIRRLIIMISTASRHICCPIPSKQNSFGEIPRRDVL